MSEVITLGNVITIVMTVISIGGMGLGFVWAIKANTMVLDTRMSANSGRLDETNRQMQIVQADLKELNRIIGAMATQNERTLALEDRVAAQSRRIDRLEQSYEELRHGEGFIYPLVLPKAAS